MATSVSNYLSVNIEEDVTVKALIESKKLEIEKGSSYFQITKPENIQLNKDIIIQKIADKSPNFITGDAAKKLLKIPAKKPKSGKHLVDEEQLKTFNVFIQVANNSKQLQSGTTFLYRKEVGDVKDDVEEPTSKRAKKDFPSPSAATTSKSVAVKKAATSNPSNEVEVVISFDTTASMYPCLSTVRSVIRETLERLTTSLPRIRIGIIAHGDYDSRTYLTKAANDYKMCSSGEVSKLIDFVTNTAPTVGYTVPECYELVLKEVLEKFDWSENANKSLVMIGDAPAHEKDDNPGNIEWRQEARKLKDKGIRVYAVQALHRSEADYFYRELAQITMGFYLRLHQFSSITDFLTAVCCFHEGDTAQGAEIVEGEGYLDHFEDEVGRSGRMVNNLRNLFDRLRGKEVAEETDSLSGASGLKPISPSRFQVLTVDEDKPIKQFAEERGLVFKVGRGFYEFTKPEAISNKKEVVLMDKTTGNFFTGWAAAREYSGIDPGIKTKQIPKESDKFVVFVQSSSYNRKLIAGQRFLYEVDTSI